ncbi:putative arsenical pump membrane protein, ArsB [Helianthus anomalus]
MAPIVKVVLGSIAFAVFWVLAVFPAVPFMPIGRTAGSLLGAMLMVVFQVLKPDQAYDSIDLPILGLLFGTMVVGIYLERADMFKYLDTLLTWHVTYMEKPMMWAQVWTNGLFCIWRPKTAQGPKDLLCRVCLVSPVSSAFFTNDTSCVVLTEFVLKIARQQNLPPRPFLLALASSSNIGSAATPIGNPQNLVIAVQSKIPFGKFLFGIVLATVAGGCVNALILLCMFWKVLSVQKDEEEPPTEVINRPEEDVNSHRFSPATMSHLTSQDLNEAINSHTFPGRSGRIDVNALRNRVVGLDDANSTKDVMENGPLHKFAKWKLILWKIGVYVITVGMLVCFLMELDMSWTAVTAAMALVILDFKDARPCLEKVYL